MRSRHGLLTNDSLIVAAMNEYGIGCLATREADFDQVAALTIYKPTDI
jgi:predicted nucleic acid-binding protein